MFTLFTDSFFCDVLSYSLFIDHHHYLRKDPNQIDCHLCHWYSNPLLMSNFQNLAVQINDFRICCDNLQCQNHRYHYGQNQSDYHYHCRHK